MNIHTKISDDKSSITIKMPERFTFESHSEFRKAYDNDNKCRFINVDMARTQYMDSSALGMLLQLKEQADKQNSKINIVNVNDNILSILKIAKFDQMFSVQ